MKISTTEETAREGQGGTPIRPIRKKAPARWLVPLLAILLVASACGGISSPQGYAEPQLEGDTLYASIDEGKMAALDASDFSLIWEFPRGDTFACGDAEESDHDLRAIYGAPVIDGGRVYFGAYDGNVYAVDAQTGDCAWESHKTTDSAVQCYREGREPDGPIIGGMVLVDGIIYVGSEDGQLYGVDAETGDVQVCVDVGAAVWTTPLLLEERLLVATMDGSLWAASLTRPGDPEPTRIFETDAGLLTDPVLAGDTILVGGLDQKLFAIDAATGDTAWEFEGGNWFWGTPVVDGDTIYATNLDGKVYAINAETGVAAWESNPFKAEEAIRAAPLLSAGALVVVDRGGNVHLLNPEDGSVKKDWPAVIEKRVLANPIGLNGDALLIAQNGNLYRLPLSGDEPPRRVEVVD